MRVLLWVLQLSVFAPLLLGIDQSFRLVLGPARWPGMPGITWAIVGGAVLALIASLLTEVELRKSTRRDALRSGCARRM
jgi:hypothetical protein